MRKVLSFSLDDEKDKDLIRHIKNQSNASAYIADLIRKDMNAIKSKFTDEEKNEIIKIVKQFLEENEIDVVKTKKDKFDPKLKSALDQFDNM